MTEEKPKREFKGIWIPKAIWLDSRLTYFEKFLLAEIDSLDDEVRGCWADNEYFLEFFGISERHLSTALTKLKKLGLIHQASFDGRKRSLKAGPEPDKEIFCGSESQEKSVKEIFCGSDPQFSAGRTYNREYKEEHKSNVPDPSDAATTPVETSSEASKMARYLLMKRDRHFPKMKQPRIDGWIKELDLMHRRDGRSWEEIKAAIDFAMEDAFWCKNILSAEKLRSQYDKLYAKMTPVQNSGTMAERNRETAIEMKNYFKSKNKACDMQIFKDKVYIPHKNETLFYAMNSSEYEKLLFNYYGLETNEQ